MLRIDGVKLSPYQNENELEKKIIKLLGTKPDEIKIYKKAVDARKKADVHFVYSVIVSIENEEKFISEKIKKFETEKFEFPVLKKEISRPVVVGTGPAGSFAALVLARAGARPIILERGKSVEERKKDTEFFFKTGVLNENSNVQFGEGGAGTFSDGKLNTGTHSPLIRTVLEEYVHFGASEKILTDAKPHIGTDVLIKVAQNMRKEIETLGGTYLFSNCLKDIEVRSGAVKSVAANDKIDTDSVILAIGHSSRDTFYMLSRKGVAMSSKPFSVGVRIEHPQEIINKIQYGEMFCNHKNLPPADYKFGSDCYSFCMCPGGYVVAAASEHGGIVTNGMSYMKRDGENANSALLVNVDEKDYGDGLFAGVEFQRKIERTAFGISDSYNAPCQKLSDFLKGCETKSFGCVKPTYEPNIVPADLSRCLPERVRLNICSGIEKVNRKMQGFLYGDAVLTAPETRSSSPVRIERDRETSESVNVSGLYPCGEGAGYAGGIMSAAVDGIKCAIKLIEKKNKE